MPAVLKTAKPKGFVGSNPTASANLIPGFATVADSQNDGLSIIIMVKGDIGALAEIDYPLSILGEHFFDRTTYLWMFIKHFYALTNCIDSTLRSF